MGDDPVSGTTIWVGASGSATGFGMLQSIRGLWGDRVRLVALDTAPSELNASSVIADQFVQVPAVADRGYQEALDSLVRRVAGPTIYIPVYDSEILAAARRAEAGGLPRGFQILVAGSSRAIAACNDKLLTYQVLATAGLPAAETVLPNHVRFDRLPLALKRRDGVASAISVVASEAELRAHRSDGLEYVAQELCVRPEVTVDAFIGRGGGPNEGVTCAIARERLQVKAGVATKCRIFQDDRWSAMAGEIAAAFQLSGAFCFQAMQAPAPRSWRVTDVNPRSGGGTRMSAAIGCDFMAANVADFLKQPAGALLRPRALPRIVVRQHAEYVTSGPRSS
jgi:carbamoylphosphate synthase large subunit